MINPTISFELFPPKTEKTNQSLMDSLPSFAKMSPSFMSVTYGAGGSSRGGTYETVTKIQDTTNIPVAAHLTYIGDTRDILKSYVDRLWQAGIKRLVALRGDLPADLSWPLDKDEDYFQFTSDFVQALKQWHDFDISVAAYPEKHPDALSMADDIRALKLKCEAGANRAITQFFFDNEAYWRFVDQAAKAGIDTPIVPGILPIQDYAKMVSFAQKCGTIVPAWLHERFDGASEQDAQKIGQDIFVEQVMALKESGVPHFHFYTLNKVDLVKRIADIV